MYHDRSKVRKYTILVTAASSKSFSIVQFSVILPAQRKHKPVECTATHQTLYDTSNIIHLRHTGNSHLPDTVQHLQHPTLETHREQPLTWHCLTPPTSYTWDTQETAAAGMWSPCFLVGYAKRVTSASHLHFLKINVLHILIFVHVSSSHCSCQQKNKTPTTTKQTGPWP